MSAKSAGQVLQGQALERGALGTAVAPTVGPDSFGIVSGYSVSVQQEVPVMQAAPVSQAGGVLLLLGVFSLAVLAAVVLSSRGGD